MAESPANSDTLSGIGALTFTSWIAIGGLLIAQGTVHGIAMIPAFAAAYLLEPSAFAFALFGGAGWVVFHVIYSIDILREKSADELKEMLQQFTSDGTTKAVVLLGLYLNVVILTTAIIGLIVSSLTNSATLGLVVALFYPNVEFSIAESLITPGAIVLVLVMKLLHMGGLYRSVDARKVIGNSSPKRSIAPRI